jgi:phosphatidylserine/phosphatidylglycerophosphate/cardiolipin synthase-like enzyme
MVEGRTPGVPNARLVIGGRRSLDAMLRVADQATEQLDVDVFAGKSPWFDEIVGRNQASDALYLADPEVKRSISRRIKRTGARYVGVGAEPAKNHAKSVVADARTSIVSTAAFAPMTPYRYEVSVGFTGDAAEAMSEVTRSRASHDAARIVAAADNARQYGILVNDPQFGVWHLTDEVNDLVRNARHRLIVASKRVEEPGIMADIAAAKRDGVPVGQYRRSALAFVEARRDQLHANIVIADDRAYIGSGHLTKRVLTGGGSNGRVSRELGVVIDDPALVDRLAQSLSSKGYVRLNEFGVPTGMSPLSKFVLGVGVLGALGGGALLAHNVFASDD